MIVPGINRGCRWFPPWIMAAVAMAFLAGQANGEEPETVVGAFVVWGKSSGAVKEIRGAGLGFKTPSKVRNLFITGSAAVGEGKAKDDDAPEVNFSSATLGFQSYLTDRKFRPDPSANEYRVGPFIGLEAYRRTAYVSVESLNGIDVIEVDYGAGVIFGTDIPAGLWPVALQARYEWGRKPPKVESSGLCAGWGPIELCFSRSKVQGHKIDTFRTIGKWQFGGSWPWRKR